MGLEMASRCGYKEVCTGRARVVTRVHTRPTTLHASNMLHGLSLIGVCVVVVACLLLEIRRTPHTKLEALAQPTCHRIVDVTTQQTTPLDEPHCFWTYDGWKNNILTRAYACQDGSGKRRFLSITREPVLWSDHDVTRFESEFRRCAAQLDASADSRLCTRVEPVKSNAPRLPGATHTCTLSGEIVVGEPPAPPAHGDESYVTYRCAEYDHTATWLDSAGHLRAVALEVQIGETYQTFAYDIGRRIDECITHANVPSTWTCSGHVYLHADAGCQCNCGASHPPCVGVVGANAIIGCGSPQMTDAQIEAYPRDCGRFLCKRDQVRCVAGVCHTPVNVMQVAGMLNSYQIVYEDGELVSPVKSVCGCTESTCPCWGYEPRDNLEYDCVDTDPFPKNSWP